MTAFEHIDALEPADDGAPPAGSKRARPPCLLVVLHTPSGKSVGDKVEIDAPVFTVGARGNDLVVEGAVESGTRAELVWTQGADDGSKPSWHLKGSGRLSVNDDVVTDQALKSGDEVRIVDSLFRFLTGSHAQQKFYDTISDLAILDFASGAHNHRYLTEVLFREKERALRRGRTFSVAVIALDPHPDDQEVASHRLRPLVRELKKRSDPGWVLASTGDLELTVVAPRTASELGSDLAAMMPDCLPRAAHFRIGTVEHDLALGPEHLLQSARSNAVASSLHLD